jgi:hypothetical protein
VQHLEGEVAAVHSVNALRKIDLLGGRRHRMIAHDVPDPRQTRGCVHVEPGGGDRRRRVQKQRQATDLAVAAQIHQDVDLEVTDQRRELAVVEPGDVLHPVPGIAAIARKPFVRLVVGEQHDLDPVPVVAVDRPPHRLHVSLEIEVGGEEAHPQPAG